jgi:K+-transporting ATPase A subunit
VVVWCGVVVHFFALALVVSQELERENDNHHKQHNVSKRYRDIRPLESNTNNQQTSHQDTERARVSTYNQVTVISTVERKQLVTGLVAAVSAIGVRTIELNASELVVDTDVEYIFQRRHPIGPNPPITDRVGQNEEAVEENEDRKED